MTGSLERGQFCGWISLGTLGTRYEFQGKSRILPDFRIFRPFDLEKYEELEKNKICSKYLLLEITRFPGSFDMIGPAIRQ